MSAKVMTELATSFFDAIERGDIDAVRAIYAPDAIVWHNTDGLAQPVADNLATLTNFIKFVARAPLHTERRLDVFDGGFVEQHLLKGKAAQRQGSRAQRLYHLQSAGPTYHPARRVFRLRPTRGVALS